MSIININLISSKGQCFSQREGMLMVELLVSIFLISIFTLVIVYYQTLIVRWQRYTTTHLKITNSMHNFLESARFNSKLLFQSGAQDEDVHLQWSLYDTPVSQGMPMGMRQSSRFKTIELKGWIDDYQKAYTIATGIIV